MLVLGLTLVTGFSGLVYEIVWQRYVAILLGSDSASTAAVLGIFLGGLALGYAIFGAETQRIVRRASQRDTPPPLLPLYGAVELLIGCYALLFPWTFSAIQRVSLWIPATGAASGFAVDVLLTALLIGPPTILMGATIPMLTQVLPRRLEESTRIHAWVYGLNTLGAFVGALAAGFYLVPRLGLADTVRAMGIVNLIAGLLLAGLGVWWSRSLAPREAPDPAHTPPIRGYGLCAAAALLSGFAMMSLQTALNRLGALALGASHFTFSTVVATFVFSIALGSLAVSQFRRIPPLAAALSQWTLAALLIALYAGAIHLNYAAHVLRTLFQSTEAAFFAFHVAVFLSALALLVVPVGLAGALLPLLFHILRREAGELGAVAGRLYGWNTLGSLLGALLGGYALLFWIDLHAVFRVAGAAVALSAALLTLRLAASKARLLATAGFVCVLVALVALRPWPPGVLAMGAFKARTETPETLQGSAAFIEAFTSGLSVLFHTDGPHASATVLEEHDTRALYVNGKSDGNAHFDYLTMGLGALIPALLAERAESAFVVGYGLGITVGELAALDSMRRVVVAEISESVLDAAPFFDASNLEARARPEVEIVRGDAYRALLRDETFYDVIVSEPSHPWVLGVEMVFSQEFLKQARARLNPGGIYAQWIHRDEMDPETLGLVLGTYATVFEDISIWYTLDHDLILIGFNRSGGAPPLDRVVERAAQEDVRQAFARLGLEGISGFLAHEILPVGVLASTALPDDLHTLQHPRLSHAAAKAFFRDPPLPPVPRASSLKALRVGARNSLAGRYAAKLDAVQLEAHREAMVSETCKRLPGDCIVLLAEWLAHDPASLALRRTLTRLQADARVGGALSAGAADLIAVLFDAEGRSLPEHLSLSTARSWQTTFFANYHYAAPFDPESLLAIWQRCADEDPALCKAGLEQIRHAFE
jgi:predicted membrane-bound spermidine synthase